MAIQEECSRYELERITASLNQLHSLDYVVLGSAPRSIKAEFERVVLRPCSTSSAVVLNGPSNDDLAFVPIPRPRLQEGWSISLTDNFIKDTKAIDRKLQGRILEALLELAKRPMEPKGKACKPLAGNLSGLWRLRIGDNRLIYRPDPDRLTVCCLAFTIRDEAYR